MSDVAPPKPGLNFCHQSDEHKTVGIIHKFENERRLGQKETAIHAAFSVYDRKEGGFVCLELWHQEMSYPFTISMKDNGDIMMQVPSKNGKECEILDVRKAASVLKTLIDGQGD